LKFQSLKIVKFSHDISLDDWIFVLPDLSTESHVFQPFVLLANADDEDDYDYNANR